MAEQRIERTNNAISYGFFGFIFGTIGIVIATIIAIFAQGLPFSIENIIQAHLNNPVLWFVDTSPITFAIVFGIIGSREDKLNYLRQRSIQVLERFQAELKQSKAEQAVLEAEMSEFQTNTQQLQANLEVFESDSSEIQTQVQEARQIVNLLQRNWVTTVDSIKDMILVTDDENRVLRCNKATISKLQTEESEIVGMQLAELCAGIERQLELFPHQETETRLSRPNGWFEISRDLIQLDESKMGFIYTLHDVTEKKQAVYYLQHLQQYFEGLFKNSPLPIVSLKPDHSVMDCNPAFEELFGYQAEEVKGQILYSMVASAEFSEEMPSLMETLSDGEIARISTKLTHKDGSDFDVQVTSIPILLSGKVTGILTLFETTDLEEAETETEGEPETITKPEVEPYPEAGTIIKPEAEPEPEAETIIKPEAEKRGIAPMPAVKITTIEGIGRVYAKKLGEYGIRTTADLLEKAGSRQGRDELAKQSGISATNILKWVNRADLMRVPGVGKEFSDLLEAAGVDTVKELRLRNANNLHNSLVEKNAEKKLAKRTPSLSEVEGWIEAAKDIEGMISY